MNLDYMQKGKDLRALLDEAPPSVSSAFSSRKDIGMSFFQIKSL
jgi:hypothetical protein